jgi:hypothetical protein
MCAMIAYITQPTLLSVFIMMLDFCECMHEGKLSYGRPLRAPPQPSWAPHIAGSVGVGCNATTRVKGQHPDGKFVEQI